MTTKDLIETPILHLNQAPVITRNSSAEEVTDADLLITQNVLNALDIAWAQVTSVGNICKLATTTMCVLESRRHLLCMQYGYKDKDPSLDDLDVPTLD